VKSK
ncbi:EPSP synthase family protein, partial [Vibrio parahaemolyticus AQ3810]